MGTSLTKSIEGQSSTFSSASENSWRTISYVVSRSGVRGEALFVSVSRRYFSRKIKAKMRSKFPRRVFMADFVGKDLVHNCVVKVHTATVKKNPPCTQIHAQPLTLTSSGRSHCSVRHVRPLAYCHCCVTILFFSRITLTLHHLHLHFCLCRFCFYVADDCVC